MKYGWQPLFVGGVGWFKYACFGHAFVDVLVDVQSLCGARGYLSVSVRWPFRSVAECLYRPDGLVEVPIDVLHEPVVESALC